MVAVLSATLLIGTLCFFVEGFSSALKQSSLHHLHRKSPQSTRASNLNLFPVTISIADGLDAETLGALGEVEDLNNALDTAIDASNPGFTILGNFLASPALLAVPILAGLFLAFGIGYSIIKYGSGRDD